MAWRHKSKDISKKMTSRDFSDYPNSDLMEEPSNYSHTTRGSKPFSPIAEEEEEAIEGDGSQPIKTRRPTTVSPRTSMSPSQSSVSPVSHSSGSGHSSPRSPPTSHTHPPPPSSQPPPLPSPQHTARPHPPASSGSTSGKPRSKSGSSSRGFPGMIVAHPPHPNRVHHVSSHVTSQSRHAHHDPRTIGHTKPYEAHHPPYPNEHHLPSQHSVPPYQWVQRASGVGKSHSSHTSDIIMATYAQLQDGGNFPHVPLAPPTSDNQSTSKHASNVAVVNSKVVPSKMYPTPVVTETSLLVNHTNEIESTEQNANEVLNDPGERGSPSGESNPSSTPNSTLGKQTHRHILDPLQSSNSEPKLSLGEIANNRLGPLEGGDDLRSSVSDTKLVRHQLKGSVQSSGTTTRVQMGNVSLSVQNARHNQSTAKQSNKTQKPLKTSKSLDSRKGEPEEPMRVLQHPKSSVASKVAQFNQNGNHSGGAIKNDKESNENGTKSPESDSKSLSKSNTSTVGVALKSSPSHTTDGSEKPKGVELSRGDSPSSSMEELATINEEGVEAEDVDSAQSDVPIVKPDPSKSKPHPHQPPQSHYPPPPPPSHHHTSHNEPPPYAHPYSSLSQPLPQGAPQGIAQGIISQSLSQGQNYVYDPHHNPNTRPEVAYSHTGMYPHPSVAYDGASNRHHHISPPQHAAQSYEGHPPPPGYVIPPGHQSLGYRTSHDLQTRSHDHYVGAHPGSHDHHMTPHHRGPPPGMQFLPQRGDQFNAHHPASKLPRPEHTVHYTKANIGVAQEAAASGDLGTLHRMITNHEIDVLGYNEHSFTLAHKAALHGRLQVLTFLTKENGMPLTALQIPDDSFTTPAMLAIQGGSVECLQWLVEEGKVPFQVRDTGGETLMHHAAFHGQVKCLEWLLKTVKKRNEQNEINEILDESGVTPAHFAAQGGHLDCLQLLIDHGYSVVHADRENQKPLDWADAMGQNICVRYLMMYETCWALSGELTHLAEQMAIVQKQNDQLREAFSLQEKDHDVTISKLRQSHEERLTKMREQHVDLMASILNMKDHDSPPNLAGGASTSSTNKKNQLPVRKAPTEPPLNAQRRSTRPPIPPDISKKRTSRGGGANYETKKERGHESGDQSRDKPEEHDGIDYRTATPQEVLEKQMTSVAQRMNASREARKRQGGLVPRAFSPLTPVIQRMYSKPEEDSKGERSSRSQRHSEAYTERRSAPKVKFSKTVTEFPDYSRYGDHSSEDSRPNKSSHAPSSSPGQSPSHGHHGNRTGSDGESTRVKGESSSDHNSRKSSEK